MLSPVLLGDEERVKYHATIWMQGFFLRIFEAAGVVEKPWRGSAHLRPISYLIFGSGQFFG